MEPSSLPFYKGIDTYGDDTMNLLGVLLLAVSLSMDALGIGISYGLRGIRTPWKARIIICIISMLFTGAAVGLGNVLLMIIPPEAARLVGAGMLVLLGLFIIVQSFWEKNKEPTLKKKGDTILNVAFKSLGITVKIIRNPASCDFDDSKHIDTFEAIYLGVALSIDSFGAGISSAVSGVNSTLVPVAAGVCQLLFLCCGDLLGRRLKLFKSINSQVFVVISGVLLIVLAMLRYFC